MQDCHRRQKIGLADCDNFEGTRETLLVVNMKFRTGIQLLHVLCLFICWLQSASSGICGYFLVVFYPPSFLFLVFVRLLTELLTIFNQPQGEITTPN